MRQLKNIPVQILLALMLVSLSSTAINAQDLDKSVVQNLIEKKEFVFKAQTVIPLTGRSRQLTSDYDVKFMGDSIIAYLPYFGRAYSAGYGEGGGVDFTSTKFDYNTTPRKKGGWDVAIKPRDAKNIQSLNFTISENGSASLQVTSNNRQSISYVGYIVERKSR